MNILKIKNIFFLFFFILLFSTPYASAEKIQWNSGVGYNSHYYEVVLTTSITWTGARDAAIAAGGYLATITSAEENAFVSSIATQNYLFIGGYQSSSAASPSSDWSWVTGEAWSYTNWNTGEPNDGGDSNESDHSEQYVEMYTGGKWNDIYSNYTRNGYIIEYNVPEMNTIVFFLATLGILAVQKILKK